jgi:hypothetical protein
MAWGLLNFARVRSIFRRRGIVRSGNGYRMQLSSQLSALTTIRKSLSSRRTHLEFRLTWCIRSVRGVLVATGTPIAFILPSYSINRFSGLNLPPLDSTFFFHATSAPTSHLSSIVSSSLQNLIRATSRQTASAGRTSWYRLGSFGVLIADGRSARVSSRKPEHAATPIGAKRCERRASFIVSMRRRCEEGTQKGTNLSSSRLPRDCYDN